METLASILSGAQGNPYQGAGGGISPLVQQLMLAQQLGGPQIGEAPPQIPAPGALNPMMPGQPRPATPGTQIGDLAAMALPGIATGAY